MSCSGQSLGLRNAVDVMLYEMEGNMPGGARPPASPHMMANVACHPVGVSLRVEPLKYATRTMHAARSPQCWSTVPLRGSGML